MLNNSSGAFNDVWKSDQSLSAHYATPVYKDGYLYGFDGRQEMGPALVCVNAADGKVVWRKERFGAGTVTLSDDLLVVMTEKGELAVVLATPAKFEELARAQILGSGVRAYPAVSDGAFYARDKTSLVKVALFESAR